MWNVPIGLTVRKASAIFQTHKQGTCMQSDSPITHLTRKIYAMQLNFWIEKAYIEQIRGVDRLKDAQEPILYLKMVKADVIFVPFFHQVLMWPQFWSHRKAHHNRNLKLDNKVPPLNRCNMTTDINYKIFFNMYWWAYIWHFMTKFVLNFRFAQNSAIFVYFASFRMLFFRLPTTSPTNIVFIQC